MGLSDLLIYSGTTPLRLILWSFYIAIVISTICMYITKVKFGKLVYALLEKEALTPESALTLDEIGVKPSFFIRTGLKNHLNYKNLLVAITEDGRYYANTTYTADPPEFKTLVAITRKRRSRITESEASDDTEKADEGLKETAEASAAEAELNTPQITQQTPVAPESEAPSEEPTSPQSENETQESTPQKPERVKFDILTAKYYIPSEILAKVRSLYNDRSVKLWWIILILIGLGVITYFAGFVTEGLVDMLKSLGE